MIKAVVDTNILISSLLASGPSKIIVDAWLDKKFALITSHKLLLEFLTVVAKPKFSESIPAKEGIFLAEAIRAKAINVIPATTIHACRDPKDNMIIEAAIAAKADVIVSGDKDILALNPFRSIKILSPKEFLNLLNKS